MTKKVVYTKIGEFSTIPFCPYNKMQLLSKKISSHTHCEAFEHMCVSIP